MGEAVVTDSAVMMESLKFFWKFCGGVLLSKARMVKSEMPAVVGVPLSCPPGDKDNPAGRFPDPATRFHV
jgi:hypothetical protein